MNNFKIEINFDDLIEDMFVDADIECEEFVAQATPTSTFKDALREDIINKVSNEAIKMLKDESIDTVNSLAKDQIDNFVQNELADIVDKKLKSCEISTRFDGFKSLDELIDMRISKFNIESIIEKHIDRKSDQFAKEMKARYDNIFAAKIVNSLKEQKMLNPDVAKILLGDID